MEGRRGVGSTCCGLRKLEIKPAELLLVSDTIGFKQVDYDFVTIKSSLKHLPYVYQDISIHTHCCVNG
jgi:hypothetical protein